MSTTLSRILVAVDGSENADKAFHEAVQLAKKTNSSLYVIFVAERYASLGGDHEVIDSLLQIAERQGKELLTKYSAFAKSKYDLDVQTVLAIGYPAKVIIEIAKEKDVNLIVVGSRGLSGVKEMFLGSVSHSVVRSSKVPVLVVK